MACLHSYTLASPTPFYNQRCLPRSSPKFRVNVSREKNLGETRKVHHLRCVFFALRTSDADDEMESCLLSKEVITEEEEDVFAVWRRTLSCVTSLGEINFLHSKRVFKKSSP